MTKRNTDEYNEDQTIRKQCYDEVKKGGPVYLRLIQNILKNIS